MKPIRGTWTPDVAQFVSVKPAYMAAIASAIPETPEKSTHIASHSSDVPSMGKRHTMD